MTAYGVFGDEKDTSDIGRIEPLREIAEHFGFALRKLRFDSKSLNTRLKTARFLFDLFLRVDLPWLDNGNDEDEICGRHKGERYFSRTLEN